MSIFDDPANTRPAWWEQAACRTGCGANTRLFYCDASDVEGVALAQKLCGECPVKVTCYEYAVAHREQNGIWGGVFFEPRYLAKVRRRARAAAARTTAA